MAYWGHELGIRLCQSQQTRRVWKCDRIYGLDLSTNEGKFLSPSPPCSLLSSQSPEVPGGGGVAAGGSGWPGHGGTGPGGGTDSRGKPALSKHLHLHGLRSTCASQTRLHGSLPHILAPAPSCPVRLEPLPSAARVLDRCPVGKKTSLGPAKLAASVRSQSRRQNEFAAFLCLEKIKPFLFFSFPF